MLLTLKFSVLTVKSYLLNCCLTSITFSMFSSSINERKKNSLSNFCSFLWRLFSSPNICKRFFCFNSMLSNSSLLNGFKIKSLTPIPIALRAYSNSLYPVTSTIIISLYFLCIISAASSPSSSGILISAKIISALFLSTKSTSSCPFFASPANLNP